MLVLGMMKGRGDGLVGKEFSVQTREPKFRCLAPTTKHTGVPAIQHGKAELGRCCPARLGRWYVLGTVKDPS